MHSSPPQGGFTFNQILVIVLLTAIIVLGALMAFEPKLRHSNVVNAPAPPTQSQPNSLNNNNVIPEQ